MGFIYDCFDRVAQDSTPQGTVDCTFNDAGPLTGMTESGQIPVACVRNDANRLTNITQGSASVAFTYDTVARRTSAALPNSVLACTVPSPPASSPASASKRRNHRR